MSDVKSPVPSVSRYQSARGEYLNTFDEGGSEANNCRVTLIWGLQGSFSCILRVTRKHAESVHHF